MERHARTGRSRARSRSPRGRPPPGRDRSRRRTGQRERERAHPSSDQHLAPPLGAEANCRHDEARPREEATVAPVRRHRRDTGRGCINLGGHHVPHSRPCAHSRPRCSSRTPQKRITITPRVCAICRRATRLSAAGAQRPAAPGATSTTAPRSAAASSATAAAGIAMSVAPIGTGRSATPARPLVAGTAAPRPTEWRRQRVSPVVQPTLEGWGDAHAR